MCPQRLTELLELFAVVHFAHDGKVLCAADRKPPGLRPLPLLGISEPPGKACAFRGWRHRRRGEHWFSPPARASRGSAKRSRRASQGGARGGFNSGLAERRTSAIGRVAWLHDRKPPLPLLCTGEPLWRHRRRGEQRFSPPSRALSRRASQGGVRGGVNSGLPEPCADLTRNERTNTMLLPE